MAINKKTVESIAHLSRLSLSEEDAQSLTKELGDILGYAQKLNKLDVSSVEPMSHVLALKNVYRQDEQKHSLTSEKVLDNAPQKDGGLFKVPRII